jgi:hypothetical protein
VKKSMIVILKALGVDAADSAEAAESDFVWLALRKPQRPLRFWFVLFGLALFAACQTASSRPPAPQPVSAGTLSKEYQESTADTRRKYDGREITVRGLAQMAAMMPPPGEDEGLILLEEQAANPPRRVACWFSKDRVEQFTKVTSGQSITVTGIFNGEAGAELKFCKLVKID